MPVQGYHSIKMHTLINQRVVKFKYIKVLYYFYSFQY